MSIIDKITGRTKKAAGDFTGDPGMREKGRREEEKGKAREEETAARQRAEEQSRKAEHLDRDT